MAKVLNDKHGRGKHNGILVERTHQPDDIVWVRRPEHTADKFGSRWIGQGVVVAREGARSYLVRVQDDDNGAKKAHVITVPLQNMKAGVDDDYGDERRALYVHRRTESSQKRTDLPQVVKKILKHRYIEGRLEFQIQWEGDEAGTTTTWEGFNEVFPHNQRAVSYYTHRKGLGEEVLTQFM